jgi:hypothetical protein
MHLNCLRRCTDWFFWVALCCCALRFWVMALPNGFWVDETVTAFVVRYGLTHKSRNPSTIYCPLSPSDSLVSLRPRTGCHPCWR